MKRVVVTADGMFVTGVAAVPKTHKNYSTLLSYALSDDYDPCVFKKLLYGDIDLQVAKDDLSDIIKLKDSGEYRVELDGGLSVTLDSATVEKLQHILSEDSSAAGKIRKFWHRCQCNPVIESVELLCEWITRHNLSLDSDGCFFAFKGVRDDYRDCHSGTFDNSPNRVVEMPREEVVFDPDMHCAAGLHVADINYAHSFGSKTMLVVVDPADVVSVPNDENCAKMRVCRYRVIKDITDMAAQYGLGVPGTEVVKDSIPVRTGEWTEAEDFLLKQYADKGALHIVATILCRTYEDCLDRFDDITPFPVFDKLQKPADLSDRLIKKALRKYGTSWAKLAEVLNVKQSSIRMAVKARKLI